jgi:hypothetical protein
MRIAVIENEFADAAGVESLILKQGLASSVDDGIYELPNGCLCCENRDSLVATLQRIMARRDRFDYVLIETSGMADPGPVAAAFWSDLGDDGAQLTLDGVIAVVDAARLPAQLAGLAAAEEMGLVATAAAAAAAAAAEHRAGGSVYADLPFHLNITTSFLSGANEAATIFSSLLSSFFAGATLAYPFLPDFYIAALVAGGASLRSALVVTSAVLLTALFGLVWALNARITGSTRAGALAVWLTLFAGGVGGFYYVAERPDWWHPARLTSTE